MQIEIKVARQFLVQTSQTKFRRNPWHGIILTVVIHFVHLVRKMFTTYFFGGDISYESRLQCWQKGIT
jgi:hypothetical protein